MIFGILCILMTFTGTVSLTQYYIEKHLLLRYNNKELSNIIVDKQIGTFYLPLFDGDEQVLEYVKHDYLTTILKPRKEPKTIFKHKSFLSKKWNEKYSVIVGEELTRLNKKWNELNEIIKIEKRYVVD